MSQYMLRDGMTCGPRALDRTGRLVAYNVRKHIHTELPELYYPRKHGKVACSSACPFFSVCKNDYYVRYGSWEHRIAPDMNDSQVDTWNRLALRSKIRSLLTGDRLTRVSRGITDAKAEDRLRMAEASDIVSAIGRDDRLMRRSKVTAISFDFDGLSVGYDVDYLADIDSVL